MSGLAGCGHGCRLVSAVRKENFIRCSAGWRLTAGAFTKDFFTGQNTLPDSRLPKNFPATNGEFSIKVWAARSGSSMAETSNSSRRRFPNFLLDRQSDLWSGIGLAATYAGIISETSLGELREKAGSFQPQLAQGAAFAAKARQRAGNLTDYTSLATKILCGLSADAAARITDAALENLPADADVPAYEIWRRRIQNHFAPNPQLQ